jgi:hypothetical protein
MLQQSKKPAVASAANIKRPTAPGPKSKGLFVLANAVRGQMRF